ncbi:MAG: HNH endonuclease [Planctomycetota bacterium]
MIEQIRIKASVARLPGWQPFNLYDPDTDQDSPQNPVPKYEADGRAMSIPLMLDRAQYKDYRKTLTQRDPHCVYCGDEVTNDTSSLDHVVPQSRGGKEWPANLVLCCRECNTAKSDMTLHEWRESIIERIAKLDAMAETVQGLIDDGASCFVAGVKKVRDPEPTMVLNSCVPRAMQPVSPELPFKEEPDQYCQNHFDAGRASYQIVDNTTKKPILRRLSLNQAVHVVTQIEHDTPVSIWMVRPFYRAEIGLPRPPRPDLLPEEWFRTPAGSPHVCSRSNDAHSDHSQQPEALEPVE